LVGCSDFEHKQKDEYFIKVGSRTITVADFNKAFEIAKNAYSKNRIQQPDIALEARLLLIQQMTEEMILLQRAEELGITVADSQVEKALRDIKKDYPDNVFQDILIEYAIPYQFFTEGLKTRLTIEKVITQELGNKIEVTNDDILKYHDEHFKDDDMAPDKEHIKDNSTSPDVKTESKEINNKIIIKILRKEKLEKAYAPWIKQLKNKYTVEINKEELKKMAGL
jgi:parvulin-like peptidyl-prolyl isomerase